MHFVNEQSRPLVVKKFAAQSNMRHHCLFAIGMLHTYRVFNAFCVRAISFRVFHYMSFLFKDFECTADIFPC